jgi:sialic acid synthase SpsE
MSKVILRNNRILENYGEPYFVAEFNTSHNGSVETAKEMIRQAKEVGCDCVKFQSWSTESLYSKTYYDDNPIAKRFVKKFALNESELLDLAAYCKEVGISFASTPYSQQEVDFLIDQCDVPYIKIASMDLVTYPFLEYIAKKDVPIVLATGMGDINEIRKAVSVIENAGNQKISILHCISVYPAEIESINLNNLTGLKEEFPDYPIGFSDHSLGCEMPIAAIGLGAAMIEKHFTLDKTKIGMDNQMAMEPDEMRSMINQCRNVHVGLGIKDRVVSAEELEQRIKMRRSIVVIRDMAVGSTIQIEDLGMKRPGTGIPPEQLQDLIGKKLITDVNKDSLISNKDFE